jgi:hypothetical protein
MPMNSKYSRPLATTPTMPSTIATITSSRRRAIIRSSAQLGGSWPASAFFTVFRELPSRRTTAGSPSLSPVQPTDLRPILHLQHPTITRKQRISIQTQPTLR